MDELFFNNEIEMENPLFFYHLFHFYGFYGLWTIQTLVTLDSTGYRFINNGATESEAQAKCAKAGSHFQVEWHPTRISKWVAQSRMMFVRNTEYLHSRHNSQSDMQHMSARLVCIFCGLVIGPSYPKDTSILWVLT